MNNILNTIAAYKKKEVEARRNMISDNQLLHSLHNSHEKVSMSKSIEASKSGIIAEFKRRSPSLNDIHPRADVTAIVPAYQSEGAAACSILTDTRFFGGSIDDLALARSVTDLPLLRKEFVVDLYQIVEAAVYGANAVLLIAAILDKEQIAEYSNVARQLGMESIMEIHSLDEIDKFADTVDIIGVNNRNLRTFVTDIQNSVTLASHLPNDKLLISESGIHSINDIKMLREHGYKGFLIGESFMKHDNPGEALKQFIDGNI